MIHKLRVGAIQPLGSTAEDGSVPLDKVPEELLSRFLNQEFTPTELEDMGVTVLGINCGRSLEDNLKALQELRQATSLPLWFKPNAGMPHTDEAGNLVYDVSPEMMAAQVPQWIEAGARLIGGCCGTSPEHLKAIAGAIKVR